MWSQEFGLTKFSKPLDFGLTNLFLFAGECKAVLKKHEVVIDLSAGNRADQIASGRNLNDTTRGLHGLIDRVGRTCRGEGIVNARRDAQ